MANDILDAVRSEATESDLMVPSDALASGPVPDDAIPGLDPDLFEGVLTALANGQDIEAELSILRDAVRNHLVDAGGIPASADHAAEIFLQTFRVELFDANLTLSNAADYAEQAMIGAFRNFDPDAQAVDPADALLAAIASGEGVEEAVAAVVARMAADGDSSVDPALVESAFLAELQDALAQGESPEAAVAAADAAAQGTLDGLQQASVPVDNPILAALAGGENVDAALADAIQAAGGDSDAFVAGLEASLADGMDADAALADAAQGAEDAALAKGDASVELSAAERLAQALANGENVSDILAEAGGGDAFAAALEEALASGVDSGAAVAQADEAQAQQLADAAQQSVPLSAADQLAASLASGEDMDAIMAQIDGNEAFAAALQESLAEGAAPDSALESGGQAAAAADAIASEQGVPVSPADKLAASLASGEDVSEALAEAGGGEAFGEELAAALADGQSPSESVAQANAAQDVAETVAQEQSVPADPAAAALAQGGDAAKGVDLASAVADATGTTGGETAGGETAGQTQPAGTSETQETQTATAEPQISPSTETATSPQNSGQTTPEQTQQTASQSDSETAQSVDQVAEGPGEGGEESDASDENSATGGGVTKAIEVASTETGDGQTPSKTGQGDVATTPEGGGSDELSDEEIEALQDIETAAGGNTPGGTNTGFSGLSDFEAAKTSTNIGGSNSPLGGTGTTTPTTTGPTAGGIRTTTSQNTRNNDTPQEQDPFINSAPTANADAKAMTENEIITIPVLANDTDPDGHSLSISTANVPPGQGTVAISGASLTFTPGTDFDDLDAGDEELVTISYSITDGFGGSSSATVTVTVTGTNDGPVVTVADSTVTGDVSEATDNAELGDPALTVGGELRFVDVDADDSHMVTVTPQAGVLGSLAAAITTDAEGGTGTVTWTYTADEQDFDSLAEGAVATEVFRVTVTDSQGATTFQDVRVTITGTNDSPVANADVDTTSENAAVTVSVIANDTDVDNATDDLTVTSAATDQPDEGTVTFFGGNITYDPGTVFDSLGVGESRVVQVNYTVRDPGGLTASSTLDITVTGTNDVPIVSAPVTVAPVSENDGVVSIDLLATASDIDINDVLGTDSVTVTSSDDRTVSFSVDNTNGNLSLNSGQFGYLDDGEQVTLTVNYTVTDGNGGTVPNTASLVVTGANDAPTISGATKIYAQESFQSGAEGWSDPTVTSVPGLSQFLGNFSQGGQTEKTFSIPVDGSSVVVRFDFHRFDSWDSEEFHVLLNGSSVLQGTFLHGEESVNSGFTLLGTELEDFAFGVWDDSSYRVSLTLTADQIAALPDDGNGGKVFTLGFSSNLNQDASDESWGVDNLLIRAGSGAFRAGDEDETMSVDGLSVGDVDGDALTVTLEVPAGILMLTDGGAGAVIQNAGSSLITISGTAAAVNAALTTLTYTPEADANGTIGLEVTAHDGTISTVKTYDLFVRPVEDVTEVIRPAALDFTGTGTNGNDASFSYAIAEGFDTFPTEQGTVEFSVKTTDTTGSLFSYAVPGSPNELWITMTNGRIDVWLNNTVRMTVDDAGINDGTWHHVALSFGGGAGETALMIDGVQVAALALMSPLATGGTVVLGNDQDAVGGSFAVSQALDGQIDGVRVWNSVRSEVQIQATMNQVLDPAGHPDLVADYHMDGALVSTVDGAPDFVLQNADFVSDVQNPIAGLEQQPISLSDIDILNVDGDLLTVTLITPDGAIGATAGTGGAEITVVPGGVIITGQADDVRAAMDTATFTSNLNFSGEAQVTVTVDDGAEALTMVVPVAITAVNTAPVVNAVDHSTGALVMGGGDNLVTIPHSPALDFGGTTPMSIEMRVQTSDDVTSLQTLFDKSNLDFVDASAFRFHIAGGRMSVWNSSTNFDSAPFLQPDTWYDFALTFDGTSLRMYADGVQVLDMPFTMGITNDDPWRIGDDSQGTRDFQGLVEGLRVWNTALTEGDVLDHLANGIADPTTEAGLVAAYSFNGANGGAVEDLTGNGNTATIQGDSVIAPLLTVTAGAQIESALITSDADGDALSYSVQTGANHGIVEINPDGSFVYTPDDGYIGGDIFTLQVSDGQGGQTSQQIAVNVAPALPPVPNTPPSFTSGPEANAFYFDGASYIEVSDDIALDVRNAFTIEMWINPEAGGTLFSKDGFSDTTGAYNVALTDNGDGTMNLHYETNNWGGSVAVGGIMKGEWQHIAVSFDRLGDDSSGVVTMFVNGVQVQQGVHGLPDDLGTSLLIGRRGVDDDSYTGYMDDIRLWDHARDQGEISSQMSAELSGIEPGLVGYWNFNESDGGTVLDQSQNDNHGTVSGTAIRDNLVDFSVGSNDVYKGLLLGSDADGDSLSYSIADGPSHGTVTLEGNTYIYDHDGTGDSDSFIVAISDGTDTITQQIDVTVV